jgi:SAM-dependent methyltransferase
MAIPLEPMPPTATGAAAVPQQRSCPFCGEERATTRYDFGAQRIVRCGRCELMYLDPWPSESQVLAVYGEDYFQNAAFFGGANHSLYGYVDYIAERLNKQGDYLPIAREIRTRLGDRPSARLLEIGCGLGYFLDVAFEEGFEVAGLEFNQHAVQRLRKKYAFQIFSGALENVRLDPGSYDAVAMFDVIEHLRDPFTALERLHAAIAPQGLLVLSTMDSESFTSRLLGKRLEDFRRTREHLFFFSRKTLAATLRRHGFEPIAMRSLGHTFELAFLLDRLTAYQPAVVAALQKLVRRLHLGSLRIHVNPRTKMIVFARRSPESIRR